MYSLQNSTFITHSTSTIYNPNKHIDRVSCMIQGPPEVRHSFKCQRQITNSSRYHNIQQQKSKTYSKCQGRYQKLNKNINLNPSLNSSFKASYFISLMLEKKVLNSTKLSIKVLNMELKNLFLKIITINMNLM